ncbi:zinc finger protein 382 isoform 4-T4 [Thomomys bottae]
MARSNFPATVAAAAETPGSAPSAASAQAQRSRLWTPARLAGSRPAVEVEDPARCSGTREQSRGVVPNGEAGEEAGTHSQAWTFLFSERRAQKARIVSYYQNHAEG